MQGMGSFSLGSTAYSFSLLFGEMDFWKVTEAVGELALSCVAGFREKDRRTVDQQAFALIMHLSIS